jgi:anti-sigma factor RsiW
MDAAPYVTEHELHAWLDQELPPERQRAVEEHLATHPDEWRRLESYRADGEAIAWLFSADADGEAAVPPDPTPRRRLDRRGALAAAASVLIGVLGGGYGLLAATEAPTTEHAELIEEVTGYHLVYARETEHLVEVPATRRDELVEWLGDRLGHRLTIPDFSDDGLTFAGGRMLVVNRRPVAQLLYTRPGGMPVGFCVTRIDDAPTRLAVDESGGLRIASWGEDGYEYLVVGDLTADELRHLATRAAAQLGG